VSANATSFHDGSVVANTRYDYRVFATNMAGDSAPSNVVSATTPAPPPAPVAPTGLLATVTGANQVDLIWTDNATHETSYEVERFVLGAGPFAQVATLGANSTSFADTGLQANTTYHYRVRAVNASGPSPYSNVGVVNTQPGAFELVGTPIASASDSVIYVVDASCSMGWGSLQHANLNGAQVSGTPFEAATMAAARSIASLPAGFTFTVQTYDCGSRWWNGALMPASRLLPGGRKHAQTNAPVPSPSQTWLEDCPEPVMSVTRSTWPSAFMSPNAAA
jgi:chitodextrinase